MVKAKFKRYYRILVSNLYVKPRCIVHLILKPKRYCVSDSYYPDGSYKSKRRIWWEQLMETVRHGYPNEFYFPYGFDAKASSEIKKYLHYDEFQRVRDTKNLSVNPYTAAVLRDKLLFGIFTEYWGIKSSPNIGLSQPDGIFRISDKTVCTVEDFFSDHSEGNFFIKPIDGECGRGVLNLIVKDGFFTANGRNITLDSVAELLRRDRCLIQQTVVQHTVLSSLHPESINTIRLVTIRNQRTGTVEVFPSILRIGTGSSVVDNTSQGGIAVAIDLETGRLGKYGFFKPGYGTKVTAHPDSHVQFSNVVIPYFDTCKAQAIILHNMLSDVQSVGWDIAIGSDGPIFIEGNDNWEINGPQICNGGLRDRFWALMRD